MGDLDDFVSAIDYLAEFCCLSVDLPGHGRTQIRQNLNYQMPLVAEALIKLLKELAIADCLLAGYSMGGRLALYLAVHFPQYFRGVVLESTSPGLKTQPERDRRIAEDLQLARRLETEEFPQFVRQWYANPLFKSFTLHPNYQQAIVKRLNNDPLRLAKSLRYIGLGIQPSLWNLLPEIRVPILSIVGERDSKFVAINREIVELCSVANLIVVEDAGHNVHFEQPRKFAQSIAHFQTRLLKR